MNIYISDVSLIHSAYNLDILRLRKQLHVLAQIISNVIRLDSAYSIAINTANENRYTTFEHPKIEYTTLPLNFETHTATLWALKSPLHFLFVMEYMAICNRELKTRSFASFPIVNKLNDTFFSYKNYLSSVLIANKLNDLYGLEKDLYKNIPVEGMEAKSTVLSYRKYLIYHWKNDLDKYYIYKKALKEYEANKVSTKPRMVKCPTWRSGGKLGAMPDFARDELLTYKKGLDNA